MTHLKIVISYFFNLYFFFSRPTFAPQSIIYLPPEGCNLWHLMRLGHKCHLLTQGPLIHNAMSSSLSWTCWSAWVKTRNFKVSKVFPWNSWLLSLDIILIKRLLDQTFSTARCCGKIRQKSWEGRGQHGIWYENKEWIIILTL